MAQEGGASGLPEVHRPGHLPLLISYPLPLSDYLSVKIFLAIFAKRAVSNFVHNFAIVNSPSFHP